MRELGSNGFDPDHLNKHLTIIDEADELATLLGEYRQSRKAPRTRIKNAMAMAKEDGINLTAFREVVAARRAKRAQERRVADLEPDDLADYEEVQRALGEFGDTPLGAAALSKAKPRGEEAPDTLA
jgi:hypothetical protein